MVASLINVKAPAEPLGQGLQPQLSVMRADPIVAAIGVDGPVRIPEILKGANGAHQ